MIRAAVFPSLTWASCLFISQYCLSLDWIVQRLPHSKFPSREWLSRMCLSRASHCSPASLARPQSHVLQKEIPGSLPWVPCRTYGRVCSTKFYSCSCVPLAAQFSAKILQPIHPEAWVPAFHIEEIKHLRLDTNTNTTQVQSNRVMVTDV